MTGQRRVSHKITILKRVFCTLMSAACMLYVFSTDVCAATNLADFPESYRPYIQQLAAAHPNWTFEAYNTGVSWSSVMDYETEIGVNMIEYGTGNPDYWFAKDQNVVYNGKTINLYNYSTGSYYILSDPNWVQPTEAVIAYYLDPRNFLNETDVFMFEHMVYNASYHTVANVNAMLAGTWMYNQKLEDDSSMTYAQAFVKIGQSLGLSPFLLATRIVQEQGTAGTSDLISGTYPGFTGYYNYFNINAYGETRTEIIVNGLTEAKEAGWNTRYKALYGGASKLVSYLNNNQTTLYFQKFDVASGKVSWHQYMGNIQAPLSEGRRLRNTYISCGVYESAFVFQIPVYNNMPASACQTTLPTIMGDVDRSGKVEAADALSVLKYVVGLQGFDSTQETLADTDHNGKIEANDALRILQYVVSIISEF